MKLEGAVTSQDSSRGCCGGQLRVIDLFTVLAVFAALLAHCYLKSPRKLFWFDETLTEAAVAETSFGEMISSLKEPINAMPPTYFMALWGWVQAFGASEFALRSFSCVAMGFAWIFCWLLLRRFCSRLPAAAATTVAMFLNDDMLRYNVEARPYSLYLAAFFAAAYLYVKSWSAPKSVSLLVGSFLAHAVLVTTHYVGVFYSIALVLMALGMGFWFEKPTLRTYAVAALCGAATVLFCLPFYLGQSRLGGEDNYLNIPNLNNLIVAYQFGWQSRWHVVALVIGFWGFSNAVATKCPGEPVTETGEREPARESISSLWGVYTLFIAAAAVPLVLWVESKVGIRLFLDRYLMPSLIIWPCLLGLAFDRLTSASKRLAANREREAVRKLMRALPVASCTLLIAYAAWRMAWDTQTDWAQIHEFRRIAAVAREQNAEFLSNDLLKVGPVRHYGARAHYLRIESPLHRSIFFTLADVLNRRHWRGFVVEPEMLEKEGGPFLVFHDEWNDWTARRLVSAQWRVEQDISDELFLVTLSQ